MNPILSLQVDIQAGVTKHTVMVTVKADIPAMNRKLSFSAIYLVVYGLAELFVHGTWADFLISRRYSHHLA